MSDTVAVVNVSSPVATAATGATGATVAEKKIVAKKAAKLKKPSVTPSHPPTQQMVDASIKNLKERGGSSLLAIKKYISATYKCDAQKLAPFIKRYLKSAVTNGKLIQTKGKGASGSFKLSVAATKSSEGKLKSKVVKSVEKVKAKAKAKKKVTDSGASKKKLVSKAKKAVSGEKKMKKAVASKKTAEKKKSEKAKTKDTKKVGALKVKPTKAKSATKAKATSTAAKSKKSVSNKKPAAKKATTTSKK